ncbi:hypothetical protein Glove_253g77 [Diversispora epigaea]|uniref:Uncharacterized protein n=1 Tax=Diversispora epigaea TaxID=1348612 RepID=A0A397IFC0_9GLOM|nr:hypothetical protein Glove_253g77 [Diversispora epigaea]
MNLELITVRKDNAIRWNFVGGPSGPLMIPRYNARKSRWFDNHLEWEGSHTDRILDITRPNRLISLNQRNQYLVEITSVDGYRYTMVKKILYGKLNSLINWFGISRGEEVVRGLIVVKRRFKGVVLGGWDVFFCKDLSGESTA